MRLAPSSLRRAAFLALALLPAALLFARPASTPSPALVVLSKDDSSLAIVDPATFQILARIPTGPTPHEVAVSADGAFAVASNYGAHQDGTSLSLIDLNSQKEIQRVDLGELRGPHGIVFFDGRVWFTAEASRKIARYNPATNKIDWTHDIGQNRTHMLVLSRDGHTIYTANVESNSVTVVQANADRSQWTNTNIPVGSGPEAISLSPDERELWVGNSRDASISVIDTSSNKVTSTFDIGAKHSNRLKFTPDSSLVLVSDLGAGDLLFVDVPTHTVTKRLHLGSNTEGILIVPDGSRAFVAVSGDDKVAVVDLKTRSVISTFSVGKNPDSMAWRD